MVAVLCLCLSVGLSFGQAKTFQWKLVSTWTPAINLIEADKYFAKIVERTEWRSLQDHGPSGR